MRWAAAVAAGAVAVAAGAVAVAGCGAPSGPNATPGSNASPAAVYLSPVKATVSWFYAVNHKDKADAVAHFTRAAAGQMDWGFGDTSKWPTFSALHCQLASQASRTASVRCTFVESQAPAVGNPDSFWTVFLTRRHERWFINSYGQG
jgi:hypothetical protein